MINTVTQGDCLEVMKQIPDGSVDMILADLPYGTTDVKGWDKIIPAPLLWEQYNRIIKEDGNIILFSSQPFTSYLVTSNPKMFRYEWVWDKTRGSNFLNANRQPMKSHESVLVFSKLPTSPSKKMARYFPQKSGDEPYTSQLGGKSKTFNGGDVTKKPTELVGRHPKSIQTFKKDGKLHPTQKPVALCEFLIKSYTNEGDTVLDNVAGSGTTGVACQNLNRNFILMEQEPEYVEIIKQRLVDNKAQGVLV